MTAIGVRDIKMGLFKKSDDRNESESVFDPSLDEFLNEAFSKEVRLNALMDIAMSIHDLVIIDKYEAQRVAQPVIEKILAALVTLGCSMDEIVELTKRLVEYRNENG